MSDTERLVTALRLNRAATVRHDVLLEAFRTVAVGLESTSFGVPIQILLDGRLIRGRTATEAESARRLDRSMSSLLRASTEVDFLTDMFEGDEGVFTDWERRLRERVKAATDAVNDAREADNHDLSLLPQDVAVEYLWGHRPATALMLVDAEIFDSGRWFSVGDFRVAIDRIGGWWLLSPDSPSIVEGPGGD